MSLYTRDQIEALSTTLWERDAFWGIKNEQEAPADMPRAPRGKKNDHNTLWALLVDIGRAWKGAKLTRRERQMVYLVAGIGMKQKEAGQWLGISSTPADEAYHRGIGRMVDYLNGSELMDDDE